MTDRPIIFSGPMVRALLAGRKTQTRRLATSPLRRVEVGDRLYVRESGLLTPTDFGGLFRHDVPAAETHGFYWSARTRAEGAKYMLPGCSRDAAKSSRNKVTPSIHMPRWASRLTLIVEGVKVEPLQAISETDATAEGLLPVSYEDIANRWCIGWHWQSDDPWDSYDSPIEAYSALWSGLHTKDGERWDDNPSVVALTFRVIRGNIDQVPA